MLLENWFIDNNFLTGDTVLKKLQELEAIARQLEPDHARRAEWLRETQAHTEAYLQPLRTSKAFVRDPGIDPFADMEMDEEPSEMADLLAFLRDQVETTGLNTASHGHLGYIPGGGLYPAALGDFLADISNRYSGVAFAGPGAARMELALVRWLCRLVGFPETAAGDLTSGGSIATLSAFVTARDAGGIGARNLLTSCVYLTQHVHHCVDKALHVAGLSEINKRIVPMDDHYRMDVTALERMIASDRDQGLNPWLVAASAGTTDTGAIDPITAVADIARRNGLWFHLDAAYGGFFLLCAEGRERLRGIELADSVVLDPHKGLSLPFGTGAVLIREGRCLARSHSFFANYMQDARQREIDVHDIHSPCDLSPELSRPFRGPRMWLPLKLFGLKPFRASLEEKLWLARYFHHELSSVPGFELGPQPDLSIVIYRYLPKQGDADAFNRRLHDAVLDDGRVFISTTSVDGNFMLRLAVLNFRTHKDTVDILLEVLKTRAPQLDT